MTKVRNVLILMFVLALLGTGCSYAGVAMSADGKKAVVLRNDYFIFGALRKAFVCDVTDEGLTNCHKSAKP